jgi:NAD(P)H dehydrogenase (quinone)
MSVVVTAASSHLGRSAITSLLERGVPAADITATARSTEALADLAAQGVNVVAADYHDAGSLKAAFDGADKVLLISSGSFDDRPGQHRNAIEAAKAAGVQHIVYTSGPKATTSSILLLADHGATEEALAASGVAYTALRNGWYIENYTGQVPTYLEHGMVGSAGEGKVSLALRRELGEAAAVVLTTEGHKGKVYELGGQAVTLTELAAILSEVAGSSIAYADVPVETLQGILAGAGLPEPLPLIFADVDRGISQGELYVDPSDLQALLGRPATSIADGARELLGA